MAFVKIFKDETFKPSVFPQSGKRNLWETTELMGLYMERY
jgi:hypothetical protein